MQTDTRKLGERAIVLGAGIAGTLAGRVLADHFERVTLIERDGAPDADGYRKGVPQAKLVHGVLRSGLDAINALFPGFEQELIERGAVPSRPLRDTLFVDQFGLWPRHDVGLEVPMLSRPLLERTLRDRLAGVRNVELRGELVAQELIAEGERIAGVLCRHADGTISRELGELIVDATGRGAHTGEWLRRLGFALPEETKIEVDLGYAGCFVRPRRTPPFLGALVAEPPPTGRFASLVQTQEGERMIVAVAVRGTDTPLPNDYAGVLAIAERLPHPAPFELMRDADPLTPISRFGFPASVQRHYERLERVPHGFVCIGDAICSFNPIWGQGMSVAVLEARALGELLEQTAGDPVALAALPGAFYAQAARIVAAPWQLSVGPDFAFDTTRGERKAELRSKRGFGRALGKLALQDPEIRVLTSDVYHLLKPLAALSTPDVIARVMPLLDAER